MKTASVKIYFTLMETISVMTVIIVLTTVFLPVVMKSREWGKSIKCTSNMKSISEGLLSYANDHSGLMPSAGQRVATSKNWTRFLINYDYLPQGKYNVKGAAYNAACDYYPIDHSTIWSCPAEQANIAYNKYLSDNIFGSGITYINGSKAYGFYWRGGTHYAMNMMFYNIGANARIQKLGKACLSGYTLPKIGLIMDHKGGLNEDCMGYFAYSANNIIWGSPSTGWSVNFGANLGWARHFGRANVNSSNYSSSQFLNTGASKVNVIMIDGHSEAWSNNFYWNNYHARGVEPFKIQ